MSEGKYDRMTTQYRYELENRRGARSEDTEILDFFDRMLKEHSVRAQIVRDGLRALCVDGAVVCSLRDLYKKAQEL